MRSVKPSGMNPFSYFRKSMDLYWEKVPAWCLEKEIPQGIGCLNRQGFSTGKSIHQAPEPYSQGIVVVAQAYETQLRLPSLPQESGNRYWCQNWRNLNNSKKAHPPPVAIVKLHRGRYYFCRYLFTSKRQEKRPPRSNQCGPILSLYMKNYFINTMRFIWENPPVVMR